MSKKGRGGNDVVSVSQPESAKPPVSNSQNVIAQLVTLPGLTALLSKINVNNVVAIKTTLTKKGRPLIISE
jgi:hypothetical protein